MPAETGAEVTVRALRDSGEMNTAVDLYRRGFQLKPTDPSFSPRLLAALRDNGGGVLGAFLPDGDLIGLVIGFTALDKGRPYQYSQTAVVDHEWRNAGIGRLLKLAQREQALANGIETIRWTFDPMRTRNAHFNFDVLGARGRWFKRNYYGSSDIGPEAGARSDRVVVEWDLRAYPPERRHREDLPALAWGEHTEAGGEILLGLPADWSTVFAADVDAAEAVRDKVADVLESGLESGLAIVSCVRISQDTAVYVLAREDRP
ncbi:GNAT family N-acetyltransferase [Phytomonospora sp. NPDC050363]|uniref:GNAT family N-acetyltransferase n=1 Tax=Phytomonospora sp. NPDC050363 TaxID=3155642 RepID=UPI0034018F81